MIASSLRKLSFITASVAGLFAACSHTPKATTEPRPDGVLKSEFIYETAPFPSCHASTIEETAGGLVAAWFGGTDEGNADVGIWVSRHDGKHWSAPVEVANGVETNGQ